MHSTDFPRTNTLLHIYPITITSTAIWGTRLYGFQLPLQVKLKYSQPMQFSWIKGHR